MAESDVTLFQLENVEPTQKTVGSGAYGRVIEVTTRSAAKELHQVLTNLASPQELARLQQKFLAECYQCSKLCHPNIVQFLGIYYPSEDAKLPWLVMEKMDCSLTEYLSKHKPNEVSFQTRISILHDVTLGLQYLHVQDIIHRDLSSNNILLTKQLVAKIADLGVAKVINPNRTKSHSQAPGTVIFMPPEALLVRPRYGKPVDVFSLGCVMIHMITHKWPIPKDEVYINEVTEKKTVREETERREDYLELIQEPVQLKQLILQCLNDLPEQRPSISDISKVFKELKPDLKVEKMHSILFEYEPLLLLKDEVKKRDSQLVKLETTAKQFSMQLDTVKAELKEVKDSKQALEVECQQMKSELTDQVEQLLKDKETLKQQMNAGYKEREDRMEELEEFINDQVTELDKMKAAMKQIVHKEMAVKELNSELTGQVEQLLKDKETLEQQMNAGYKEREDRIAELEEFINDQVTELDKMEAKMKQTVAKKQLLEKDYQKVNEYYNTAKVMSMACYKSKCIKLSMKPVIERSIKLSESFSKVLENIKLPGSMFTDGHFIFSHGADGDKIFVLCDMKKYYNIIGRYVVLFDLRNGRLDFIDKEVRRMCPYKNSFVALERDPKSPGRAFYDLDPSYFTWVASSIQPIPTIDIKYPDVLVYSSLLLVVSGSLLQVFAFDVKKWFKFKLIITNSTIEASLTTTYAIMNDRLYICYAEKAELYYIDMLKINDAIVTQSQPATLMTLDLTCILCSVNFIIVHEDYLVALYMNTEDKYIRWAWYYSASCDHWHNITSYDPYIDGQWFTMGNGEAAVAKLSANWSFWYGWDIAITIHKVQLSEELP